MWCPQDPRSGPHDGRTGLGEEDIGSFCVGVEVSLFFIPTNSTFQHMRLFFNICADAPQADSRPSSGAPCRELGASGTCLEKALSCMLPVTLSVGSNPPWHRPWDGDRELLREAGDSHGVTGGGGGSRVPWGGVVPTRCAGSLTRCKCRSRVFYVVCPSV